MSGNQARRGAGAERAAAETLRRGIKAAVEWGAVLGGAPALSRRVMRQRILVLAYHNIVPAGETAAGDGSLHLPQRAFAAQLDLLRRTHDVIPVEEALAARAAPRRRPRAVITFDDAYHGALTAGVEELARRGLPATIFVAPAFVGGRTFWWDSVLPDDPGRAESFRARALDEMRGRDDAVRQWAERFGGVPRALPAHACCASEDALRVAARQPGITLGSHTWSHPNLARLDGDELRDELVRPLAWLRDRFGPAAAPVLSYPYGLSSPAVERAAAEAGYRAAFRIDGGWIPTRPRAPFALPRLNVPAGLSERGFALRAAGLLQQ